MSHTAASGFCSNAGPRVGLCCSAAPDQPMPFHRKPALAQPPRPPLAGADRGGVGEQAGFFFLVGEAGEFA